MHAHANFRSIMANEGAERVLVLGSSTAARAPQAAFLKCLGLLNKHLFKIPQLVGQTFENERRKEARIGPLKERRIARRNGARNETLNEPCLS